MSAPARDLAAEQSEQQYQDSEREQLRRWNAKTPDELALFQKDGCSIPGWLNAPAWAEWVSFCTTRGWLFLSAEPHVYADGHVSVHEIQFQRASEIPGVMFFWNKYGYVGQAAPHWVCNRRRHLADVAGGVQ